MKKTDWPIRWDLLLRYRLIEIIALWEGRLTTNHICHAFGIGRQQASKDINTYLREVAPGNLEYDRHLKGYVPADRFQPTVTQGRSDEYLEVLGRDHALSETFESLDLGLPNTEILHVPRRLAEPDIVRPIVLATRQGRRLEAEYFSLTKPEGERRVLEPHTLIYSGQRWHVRAWCDRHGEYRDFMLSRFRGAPQVLPERSRHKARSDEAWNTQVAIVLRPDQRLTEAQQSIIANDYAMLDGNLRIETRAALVRYMLTLAGLCGDAPHSDPLVQQLELANRDELSTWL